MNLTPEDYKRAELLTKYLRQYYDPGWKHEQSLKYISDAKGYSRYTIGLVPAPIEIIGKTIMVDGKDITGNLGSKITYGDNNPLLRT